MAELNTPGLTGCIIDPVQRDRFWATLPHTSIRSANSDLMSADDGKDFFLFDAEAAHLKTLLEANIQLIWKVLTNENVTYLSNHAQKRNDCTSHALSGAMEDLQFVDIEWRGIAAEFKAIASEPLYGGAITKIMGRRGDNGAFTSAPIEYAEQFGFLARSVVSGIDLTQYDPNKAYQYCMQGVPSQILDEQNKSLLGKVIPVHSYEEAGALLRQGYPLVNGSNQGFSLTRDKDGFCRPQGTWAHAIRFRGRRSGRRPGLAYGQSWGPGSPSGPSVITLDDGRPLVLPEGSFFVDPDTINIMCKSGEMYALSSMKNFSLLDYRLY